MVVAFKLEALQFVKKLPISGTKLQVLANCETVFEQATGGLKLLDEYKTATKSELKSENASLTLSLVTWLYAKLREEYKAQNQSSVANSRGKSPLDLGWDELTNCCRSFRETAESLAKEVAALKAKSEQLPLEVETEREQTPVDEELAEQKMRECNLMVYSLEESSTEKDNEEVEKLFGQLLTYNPDILAVERVGSAKADKTRPVRVVFRSLQSKTRALKNGPQLKSSTSFSKVFVQEDLTKAQRAKKAKILSAFFRQFTKKEVQSYWEGTTLYYRQRGQGRYVVYQPPVSENSALPPPPPPPSQALPSDSPASTSSGEQEQAPPVAEV